MKPTEKDLEEYIEVMIDATKQRTSDVDVQRSLEHAKCIQEIIRVLRKYNIEKTDEMIKILVSIMVIPLQVLEPDLQAREYLMRKLAIHFMETILLMQLRDTQTINTETGNELDRLRHMIKETGIFNKV